MHSPAPKQKPNYTFVTCSNDDISLLNMVVGTAALHTSVAVDHFEHFTVPLDAVAAHPFDQDIAELCSLDNQRIVSVSIKNRK